MKLNIVEKPGHSDMATALTWVEKNELYTCSDDKQILRWSQDGDTLGKVATVDCFITAIACFPDLKKRGASTMFACACTDGTIRLYSLAGQSTAREEKKISAHQGAVITVKWNFDGSALISAGEDGDIKVWSRSGNLRSTLATNSTAVYCLLWGPDNDTVLWTSGKTLNLKSYQGTGRKALGWGAHSGVVLCCDWNRINDLIVSGGEDCTFMVWDAFGRQLFKSQLQCNVITSISWNPKGDCFAVGTFNSLRLCDKTGWTYVRDETTVGSLMQIAWTKDGTQLAGVGGNGRVLFAQLVNRRLEWENYETTLVEPKLINVQDANIDSYEHLEFPRDRVIEMALGFHHLVVATATQCYIYSVTNWNTPHIFDLRHTVSLIVLAKERFLMMDSEGIIIYNYNGKQVSSPRFSGLRSEFLNRETVALSPNCVAIVDRTDSMTVRCFDVATGKSLSGSIVHKCEIVQIELNQSECNISERRLAILDRNRDLYLTPISNKQKGIFRGMYKLQTQVDTLSWNTSSDMFAAIADGRLLVWYYPNVVFVDRDLLESTLVSMDGSEYGKSPSITTFHGSKLTVRKGDGGLVTAQVSCYAPLLYSNASGSRWDECLRLCRFVKEPVLWGCLAAMSIHGRNLNVAEVALAALTEVGKLEFILHVKSIPSEEARNAEMALYRRCPDEAEAILLQANPPLLYRAIKLNIRLFRWGRALALALKHRRHVDTVLGYRERYLKEYQKEETDKRFLQYSKELTVDWAKIREKVRQEKEDEAAGSTSVPK